MTAAPATGAQIVRFKASRDQACGSPWECNGITAGERVGYVPTGTGAPIPCCAACCDALEAGPAEKPAAEAGIEPEDALDPDQLASGEPGEPLCECTRGDRAGFTNVGGPEPDAQRWVHTVCGLPAYAGQPQSAGSLVPDTSGFQAAVSAALDEHGWPADDVEPEGDDPADDVEPTGEEPVCECSRITKRAKFTVRDDGVVVHEHCGRRARDEYQDRREENTDDSTAVQQPTAGPGVCHDADCPGPTTCGRVHDGTPSVAGGERGLVGAAGPADGGLVGGQAAEGRGGEGSRGAGGVGEERGAAAGPAGDHGSDPAQLAPADAVPGEPAGGLAPGLEEAQGGAAGDLGVVRGQVGAVEARPGQVGPEDSPGGLAAFYAQPSGEDQLPDELRGTVAKFYAQPSEDDEPVNPPDNPPDSDNYLGEFRVDELVAELDRRLGGSTIAVILDAGQPYPVVIPVQQ